MELAGALHGDFAIFRASVVRLPLLRRRRLGARPAADGAPEDGGGAGCLRPAQSGQPPTGDDRDHVDLGGGLEQREIGREEQEVYVLRTLKVHAVAMPSNFFPILPGA